MRAYLELATCTEGRTDGRTGVNVAIL